MANYLSPFSTRQFIDANGNPYSGAKLFTYVAGSTTKVTTYKDEAGSSSHANPIILNTRGEPADGSAIAYPIWQTGGTAVKYVLAPSTDTDPPGAAISTWDNVTGINDTAAAGVSQWVSGPVPTYVSATSFTLVGDQTSTFHVGRRVKTTNSGGTVYSTISATAYGALTTVTVVNDSGSLDSGLSDVYYGLIASVNSSSPGKVVHIVDHTTAETHSGPEVFSGPVTFTNATNEAKGSNIASATTTDIGAATGNHVHVTGTTTITGLGTVQAGTRRIVTFDGALTLTHNATSLILPGGANITTAANDVATFVSEGSGNWRCISYVKSNGTPVSASILGTPQATTSGTSFDFTVPTYAKHIILTFSGVSLSGIDNLLVQLGDSGGIESSGYVSSSTSNLSTTGFLMLAGTAADQYSGRMELVLHDSSTNTWINSHSSNSSAGSNYFGGGTKSLSASITTVRLTRTGTNTFDAGSVNVLYYS